MTTTRCVVRGLPLVVSGSDGRWSASVHTQDGWLESDGHSRYADAMAEGIRLAEDHLLQRAYRLADRESRWERRQRRALVRDRWIAAAVLASICIYVWALFGPPTEPRRAELRERWETSNQ